MSPSQHLIRLAASLFAVACTAGCGSAPRDTQANLLLITLDTTRADYLGAYGEREIETPALDALAAEGVLFLDAASSVPMTLPAHTSLLTGTYPVDHGVHDNSGFFLAPEARTLAEALRDGGLATQAVLGAYVLHHGWGLDQGFDDYDDRFESPDPRAFGAAEVQRHAAEVVDRASAWLAGQDGKRFFLWLHFYDPHLPYEAPAEYGRRYPDDPYAAEIAYTDAQLQRLFDELKDRGLYERTLIAVIGDHGEALGQHGEPDHGIFLYQPTMRVPLILRFPEARWRGRVAELVRDIDVMPTLLDYLGVAVPESVRGSSLLPEIAGDVAGEAREAYAETFYGRFHYGWSELQALRNRRYKYVRAPRPELYDLQQDPGEAENLVDMLPDVADDLRQRLEALVEAAAPGGVGAPADLDPETLARLQSLGYVGSSVTVDEGAALPDPKDRRAALPLFNVVGFRGLRQMQEGRYEETIRLVEEALRAEPNYLDGHQLKGRALLELGRYDEAVTTLERALELNTQNLTTRQLLAEAHLGRGEPQIALDLAASLRATAPRYAASYYTAADALAQMGRTDEAVATLQALIETYPDNAFAMYETGRLELRRGRVEDGQRWIEQALQVQPRLFSAHFNLALIAEERRDLERAEQEYRQELELFPGNFEAWTNLGLLRLGLGDSAEAARCFERVIELRPRLPVGYLLLARTYQLEGRPADEIRPLARKALELDPSSVPARQLLR